MNKKLDLSIVILCFIEIVCCFTPYCLNQERWDYLESITYHGFSKMTSCESVSIFRGGLWRLLSSHCVRNMVGGVIGFPRGRSGGCSFL